MTEKQPAYYSYLLRLWRVPGETDGAWRASLEDPATGERHGFASLTAMYAFLRYRLGLAFESDEGEGMHHSNQNEGET